MKNKEIKQQKTMKQCAICIIMRCAWKWLLAAGVASLLIELILMVAMLLINGNEKAGDWAVIWMGVSFVTCFIGGLAAIATYWKDVKKWVCDELRCV